MSEQSADIETQYKDQVSKATDEIVSLPPLTKEEKDGKTIAELKALKGKKLYEPLSNLVHGVCQIMGQDFSNLRQQNEELKAQLLEKCERNAYLEGQLKEKTEHYEKLEESNDELAENIEQLTTKFRDLEALHHADSIKAAVEIKRLTDLVNSNTEKDATIEDLDNKLKALTTAFTRENSTDENAKLIKELKEASEEIAYQKGRVESVEKAYDSLSKQHDEFVKEQDTNIAAAVADALEERKKEMVQKAVDGANAKITEVINSFKAELATANANVKEHHELMMAAQNEAGQLIGENRSLRQQLAAASNNPHGAVIRTAIVIENDLNLTRKLALAMISGIARDDQITLVKITPKIEIIEGVLVKLGFNVNKFPLA